MQVKSLAGCLGWRHCVGSWQLLVVVESRGAGEIAHKAYMVGRKWAPNAELWRPLIVKGCTKGEEYEGQALKCLASELGVLAGKVDVSEVIHIVTIDVVGKAPASVYCQRAGEYFIGEALKLYHPLREEVNLQNSSWFCLFIGILLFLCVYFIPVYLRCIMCYFNVFIFCNMFVGEAIFIMLCYYSTISLSVCVIPCISQDSYFEVRWGSTLFLTNCSQISVTERTTDLVKLESDRSLTVRLVWVLTSWALLWCGGWLEEMRSYACQTWGVRCAAASTSHFWLPTELFITSDHSKEHCLPSSPWKAFYEQKLSSQLWTVRTLSFTLLCNISEQVRLVYTDWEVRRATG